MKVSSVFGFLGILCLFLAPLALFNLDRSILFPYVVGKNFIWRFWVEIAFVLWASAALINTHYRFSVKNPLFISISVFMVIVLVANTLGHNPYASFWSNAERMDGYIGLLHLYIFFISFIGLMKDRVILNLYVVYLIVLGLVLSFIGLGQTKGRVDSVLGNPIYLASITLFGIFLSGYFASVKEKIFGLDQKSRFVISFASILVFLVTMYQTGTRGAVLGLLCGLLATTVWYTLGGKKVSTIIKTVSLGFIVLLVLAGGFFFSARDYLADQSFVKESNLLSRAVRISPEDRTTGFRLANWEMALLGFEEKPVLGWGQDGYIKVFTKYFNVQELHDAEPWYDRVHNVFLDWLVSSGIVGLISYLSIFGVLFWLICKKITESFLVKGVLFGLVVAYLAQNFVAFDSLASGIFIYTVFGLIFLLTIKKNPPKKNDSTSVGVWLLIPVFFVAMFSWVNYSLQTPLVANREFIKFLGEKRNIPKEEQVMEQLNVFYIPALERNTFFNEEILIHLIQLQENVLPKTSTPETKKAYAETVRRFITPLLESDPENAKLLLLYADFLNYVGDNEEAEIVVKQALALSPYKPTIHWVYAKILLSQGRKVEAYAVLKEVYERSPENELAKKLYEQSLLETQ